MNSPLQPLIRIAIFRIFARRSSFGFIFSEFHPVAPHSNFCFCELQSLAHRFELCKFESKFELRFPIRFFRLILPSARTRGKSNTGEIALGVSKQICYIVHVKVTAWTHRIGIREIGPGHSNFRHIPASFEFRFFEFPCAAPHSNSFFSEFCHAVPHSNSLFVGIAKSGSSI